MSVFCKCKDSITVSENCPTCLRAALTAAEARAAELEKERDDARCERDCLSQEFRECAECDTNGDDCGRAERMERERDEALRACELKGDALLDTLKKLEAAEARAAEWQARCDNATKSADELSNKLYAAEADLACLKSFYEGKSQGQCQHGVDTFSSRGCYNCVLLQAEKAEERAKKAEIDAAHEHANAMAEWLPGGALGRMMIERDEARRERDAIAKKLLDSGERERILAHELDETKDTLSKTAQETSFEAHRERDEFLKKFASVKKERDMAQRVAENHKAGEANAVRIGCDNIKRAEAAEAERDRLKARSERLAGTLREIRGRDRERYEPVFPIIDAALQDAPAPVEWREKAEKIILAAREVCQNPSTVNTAAVVELRRLGKELFPSYNITPAPAPEARPCSLCEKLVAIFRNRIEKGRCERCAKGDVPHVGSDGNWSYWYHSVGNDGMLCDNSEWYSLLSVIHPDMRPAPATDYCQDSGHTWMATACKTCGKSVQVLKGLHDFMATAENDASEYIGVMEDILTSYTLLPKDRERFDAAYKKWNDAPAPAEKPEVKS